MSEKPYSCNRCGKAFKSLAGREYHLRKNVCSSRNSTLPRVQNILKNSPAATFTPDIARQLMNLSAYPTSAVKTAQTIAMLETTPIKVALDKNAGQPSKYQCPYCFKPLGTPQAYKYHTSMSVCLKRAERKRKKIIGEVIDSNKVQKTFSHSEPVRSLQKAVIQTIPNPTIQTTTQNIPFKKPIQPVNRPVSSTKEITMDPIVEKRYKEQRRFYEIGMGFRKYFCSVVIFDPKT